MGDGAGTASVDALLLATGLLSAGISEVLLMELDVPADGRLW